MANILTGIRIICGLSLFCFPAFSGRYYFFYLLGGFTDAIDGTVARKMGEVSDFGSKFDTIADFVFAMAVIIKIISNIYVPLWLIIWIAVIALIKIASHLIGYIKYCELRTVHSLLNKVCGGVVYIIPLFIGGDYAWQAKALVVVASCILTTIAAIVEGAAILCKAQ